MDNVTEYMFNQFGQSTTVIAAAGQPNQQVTTTIYDANGLVTEIVQLNPGGGSPVTTFTYDSQGDLTSETLPDGSLSRWTYETIDTSHGGPLYVVTQYVDALSDTTTYAYDSANGDLLSVTDPDLNTTTYTYTPYSPPGLGRPSGRPSANQNRARPRQ